ncbi:hypothetical protein H0484_01255 [Pusillimonas sp. CC-YST705]|uniref:Lipoprotein n=1 Tax=Mesopusillimonas faecipullorum TaxID=2755040 RepID=A0ABS8C8N7_9BURK|nr:hypothetical protein [Mesopusillimonas faecipullorum]MCB5362383.1 hypothetical protein [Mesopusillimonas faecipullorum]
MKKLLIVKSSALLTGVLTIGLLSGCAALDEMEADEFRQKCQNLGIQPGSANFEQCMLQQQAISENATQHALDRIERQEEYKHRH